MLYDRTSGMKRKNSEENVVFSRSMFRKNFIKKGHSCPEFHCYTFSLELPCIYIVPYITSTRLSLNKLIPFCYVRRN